GAISGYDAAAKLIPSPAIQNARRGALPTRDEVAARLDEARAGLPFRPEAFTPFLDAVATSRDLPPLRPSNLAGTALAARFDPLLMQRAGEWRGPIVLHDVKDPAAIRAALKPSPPGRGLGGGEGASTSVNATNP